MYGVTKTTIVKNVQNAMFAAVTAVARDDWSKNSEKTINVIWPGPREKPMKNPMNIQ